MTQQPTINDQADEMLSRGFKEQIYDVFKFLPEKVCSGLWEWLMEWLGCGSSFVLFLWSVVFVVVCCMG